LKLWQRAATSFYRRVNVIHKMLNPKPPRDSKLRVEVRPLEPHEREAYAQFRPSQRMELEKRIALGHIAVVAWHEGAIISASWVAIGRAAIPYLECEIVVPSDAIYTYDAYTEPRYRGNSAAQIRYAGVCAEFLDRGFRRGYAVVAVENHAGMRSAVKSGYQVIGRHSLVRLGPWKRRWDERASEFYPVFRD
jgi:hypothetical protein